MRDGTTIFAPASGFGRAAVAVIRISGPASSFLLGAMAGRLPAPRRLSLRTLRDPATGDVLDSALIVWMPGPATFTGEDMAELHLHGGLAVRSAVMASLAAHAGCRLAEPGAFSRRAVENGRMDLTGAEGAADLIDAETDAQRRQALRQLDGVLGRKVADWRDRLIDLLAGAEAALDFSDEGDVDEAALDAALHVKARAIRDEIDMTLADGRRGERLREGFVVVLSGPPNVGKSTLLNALSRREAAIVSAIPGTTRDLIEIRCDLGGLPVLIVDTAGLRDTADPVESEGIRRTRKRMEQADLVLALRVGDHSADDGLTLSDRTILVRTKADLGSDGDGKLAVSALTGQGIDRLLDLIEARAEAALVGGDALVTRERHRDGLTRCRDHLDRVLSGPALPELLAEDLRLAVRALGEVAGRVGVEDMLNRLFSGFCIGK
ncbi:tRNA modification GTPase MnmE [Methylobacterium bullatum]|uniref:tRNA modification GTPase MnmE n=1 Tax=Methylobacterium bullatum TaxID=570505 RepID=A0A679IR70_9HYPH|nr:tRNA modification GTPase MnmE [Methylobacterium bullatum]